MKNKITKEFKLKNTKKIPTVVKYHSNIAEIARIKKTKKGYAVFLKPPVIFINDGLLNYIKNNNKRTS